MSFTGANAATAKSLMPTPSEAGAQPGAPTGAELRARVLSALVLAPVALLLAWTGGPAFAGAIAAGGVILGREWTRMADPQGSDLAFALTAGAAAGATIAASAQFYLWALAWAAALSAAAAIEALRRERAFEAAIGAAYISCVAVAMVWLRLQGDPIGAQYVTFLFVSVWGADIGAYAAGKAIGGPKLLPQISANKTWAGVVGGVVLAAVFGGLSAVLMGWSGSPAALAGAAAILGAAGLGGDLYESFWKRRFGVKDAGSLIPGHGGLFDRIDSLMTASLVMAGWLAWSAAT